MGKERNFANNIIIILNLLMKELIQELTEILDKKTLVIWASDCAEHSLSYFEEKYPDDLRPRKAIEAARLWINGNLSICEARKAAFESHEAAREAQEKGDKLSCSIARACGHAVATVHVKEHAIHTSYYITKLLPSEINWHYKHLILVIKDRVSEIPHYIINLANIITRNNNPISEI
jgi:hypothetical protein